MTGGEHEALARRLVEEFIRRELTFACAESLTAGLVSAGIADVPGASRVLRGGAVTYATEAKAAVLGVDAGLLADRGAVDADVAIAMARGALRLFVADVAAATTGVAGPSEQDGQPVGRCYVAVAVRDRKGTEAAASRESDEAGSRGQGVDVHGSPRRESLHDGVRCHVQEFTFSGERAQIREAAAHAAWWLSLEQA